MAGSQDQLMAEALAGDSLALQRLLMAHFSSLEGHVAARIPAERRALISPEDVLQETFSQVFCDIDKFSGSHEGEFLAWLRAIADNRLADAIKKLNRVKRGGRFRQQENLGHPNSSMLQLFERVCQESRTPGRSVMRREAAEALQVHVASLPEGEREAIIASYFEGKEVAEIADQLGRTPAAVRGLLHRAYRRLADLLGSSSKWFDK